MLTTSGGVKCWGFNRDGELGQGSTTPDGCQCILTPTDVPGLTSGVRAISANSEDTCAITGTGGVKCWGVNDYGQLGTGTATLTGCHCLPSPVDVSGLTSGIARVSVGASHSCAVTVSGGAKCWGSDFFFELGDGKTSEPGVCLSSRCSTVPVDVVGLSSGVSSVAAGGSHSCALTTSGGVKCWGDDRAGQLGDDNTDPQHEFTSTPVDVFGMSSGASAITAGGNNTCALTTSGGVKCWGANDQGELGIGYLTTSGACECIPTPTDTLKLGHTVAAVSSGTLYSCAVTGSGGVMCWGSNGGGQLGDGTILGSSRPVALFGPTVAATGSSLSGTHLVDDSGQIEAFMTWSGDDPYGTITGYRARMRVVGAGWTDVPLSGPMATSATILVSAPNAYEVDVRALDSRGIASVWSPVATFRLSGAQETPVAYRGPTYAGSWAALPSPASWGGSVERSTEAGDSAAIKLFGDTLIWIGTRGPAYGSADIYLDNRLVGTVDCNATTTMKRQVLFRVDLPGTPRHHLLEILNDGTAGHSRIDIDGFLWSAPRPVYVR